MEKRGLYPFVIFMVCVLTACSGRETGSEGREKRMRQVTYSVVAEEQLPEELRQIIEENKTREIRMTYEDEDVFYLIRGYGEQKTGGCRALVKSCTEDGERIYFDTELAGPEDPTHLPAEPSCPYIVIRMKAENKQVEFE